MNVIRFLEMEYQKVLTNLESGTISKEQSIGSFNVLYSIASEIVDAEFMRLICETISLIRTSKYAFQIRKLVMEKKADEVMNVPVLTSL